jgi:uncharacterized protein YutE (UPF0331/DUF86 family)
LVDPEVVHRRLRQIDRRMGWLREIAASGRDRFLADLALQAQAERHLQLAIQAVIDVALHILAEATAETPDDYGSAFLALGRAGVLDTTLAGRLRAAAGLRNVLVHAYLDVDPVQVWDHLSRLDDLERFAVAVAGYLERT